MAPTILAPLVPSIICPCFFLAGARVVHGSSVDISSVFVESRFVDCGLRREGTISAGSEDSHQPI